MILARLLLAAMLCGLAVPACAGDPVGAPSPNEFTTPAPAPTVLWWYYNDDSKTCTSDDGDPNETLRSAVEDWERWRKAMRDGWQEMKDAGEPVPPGGFNVGPGPALRAVGADEIDFVQPIIGEPPAIFRYYRTREACQYRTWATQQREKPWAIQ